MTKDNLIEREFLEAIGERAQLEFQGKLQQAFVAWYIEAEFGKPKWYFTDDAGDGGVDAVVWRDDQVPSVVLLQSKFTERIGRALLAPRAYSEFDRVVHAFRYGGDEFAALLQRVRADAKHLYRKAQERLAATASHWQTGKRAFRLITTCRPRRAEEDPALPRTAYVYADDVIRLYNQYRRGQTPRANDLKLHVDGKLPYRDTRRGVTSFLFNARVADFRKYFESNDVGRLVARNIRYELGGNIGREIRKTYEKDAGNFWYVHNGLTIICDHCTEEDETATLVNPSVVNGAQTLYSIATSDRKASPALVATRVIVRKPLKEVSHEDDDWVQKVIRGVNTQNRVRAQDFRSNEPEQLELQRLFREQRAFYERKRGEWREYRNEPRYRNFRRTSLRALGQILATTSEADGSGAVLVKRGVEVIFRDHYADFFPPRNKIGRRFERIYLAYRVAEFVRRNAYGSAREYRKERHAFWTTVWLFHLALTDIEHLYSNTTTAAIKSAFDRFEGPGVIGRRARKVAKRARKAVWAAWRKARSADPERWSSINFFKSKWGHLKVRALALPKVKRDLRSLGKELLA
jgi:hypothetical protein